MTKEQNQYSKVKTVFSTNGAEITGHAQEGGGGGEEGKRRRGQKRRRRRRVGGVKGRTRL